MIAGEGGSNAAFPDPPTGSPDEIHSIAGSLHQSATELEQTAHTLGTATETLNADWSGYAATAYRASSGALAAAARGASASLRDCAVAVAGYAGALEDAQQEMARLRRQYDDAKGREAAAAAGAATLGVHLAAAKKPAAIHQLQGELSRANHNASDAGDEATGCASRAVQALADFHHAESQYMQTLAGGQVSVGGRSLPANSPLAPPFRQLGAPGPGFGVPYNPFGVVPGGLNQYNGVLPVGDKWHSEIPGYSTYLDGRTPVEPTDDLTTAITFLAAPIGAKAVEELLATGGRALAEAVGIGSAGRDAAENAGNQVYREIFANARASGTTRSNSFASIAKQAAKAGNAKVVETELAQAEVRAKLAETVADAAGKAGVPVPGLREITSEIATRGWIYSGYVRARAAGVASRFLRSTNPTTQAVGRLLQTILQQGK